MTPQGLPNARERLVGLIAVTENRLRLIAGDGVIDKSNRAQVAELTDKLTELRAELAALDSGVRHRRDVDD